jgi:hypothetical protein
MTQGSMFLQKNIFFRKIPLVPEMWHWKEYKKMKKASLIMAEKLRCEIWDSENGDMTPEAVSSSETLLKTNQTRRRYVPQDRNRSVVYLWFI